MDALSSGLLIANAGSSSLKFDVYTTELKKMVHINCDYSDPENCVIVITDSNNTTEKFIVEPNSIMSTIGNLLQRYRLPIGIIGHRFVHGGGMFTDTVIIDSAVLKRLEALSIIDAQHTPIAVKVVEYFGQLYPMALQIACFDTTFFNNLPEVAKKLPLPKIFYEKGLRKYGFHGLSYAYVVKEFARLCGEHAASGRIIIAHLGSGSSLTAVMNGRPVDTTMSYTPCSGVIMSSRSGDIDPGVYWHMIARENLSNDEVFTLLSQQSGLVGVSGVTDDMEQLLREEKTNNDAKIAVEMFCYRVKQVIGSYIALMDGVDSIIFCGGIGEQSAVIRQRILDTLGYLGVVVDQTRNEMHLERISDETSRVGVHVIHTDESNSILDEIIKKVDSHNGRGEK